MTLQAGDRFPDLTLDSLEGPVRLSSRWASRPLVIAFMRHFGCAFCREHLIRLGRAHDELRAAGGEVIAVFQYRAEPSVSFCRSRGLPFECLGDPTRAGYKAVGLERGERREYMGVRIYRHWFRAAKVGAYVGRPQGDIAQRPGTFVVGSDGEVLLAHYNLSSPDNPAVPALVEALRRPTLRPRA
jgi:peroxiredoxin